MCSVRSVIYDDRVVINVSGMIFETRQTTLSRFPDTLLGNEEKRSKFYVPEFKEYFFNRNRSAFEAILYYYQSSGRLRRPAEVPMCIFKQEIEFFELGDEVLSDIRLKEGYLSINESPRELPKNKLQRKIWELFDQPDTSFAASCLAIFSVSVIVVAIAVSIAETVPSIREKKADFANFADTAEEPVWSEDTWFLLELAFNTWFTIEYLVRLFTSPNKCSFFTSILNIIDLVAIAPFYVSLLLTKSEASSVAALRILRIVRVFRIFKLSRYSKSLQIIGYCVFESFRELGLLILCLFFSVIVTASLLYYIEVGSDKTDFHSVPATFWFSIQTITTIGYGDMVPHSPLAKLMSAACAIFGAVTLALPVLTFVSNFNTLYYKNMLEKDEARENRETSEAASELDSLLNNSEEIPQRHNKYYR
ncbi:potassium voltage-gated channel subfamily A member 2-like [Pocillopora verrucosa]|uniref:potassium voltage-gated channel subfamily A member 2-like n=1 Tax=Pocillopora verrucosa TaxID=203993 RepID=UPI002797990F|nr:potassium voltage-gated channel subfamily A member 2-like [Pocillopora verrucosa]XP_058941991.1 potassium voltage-gated channel subfamily A member 2-like [Pocillopora verrucosa]